jgi:hypothetical protein
MINFNQTCGNCQHADVCKYKLDFERTKETLKTQECFTEPMLFELTVSCKKYCGQTHYRCADVPKPVMNKGFINDEEKMRDFIMLTKSEFLNQYSYLTEADYDATEKIYKEKYVKAKHLNEEV